MSPSPDAVRFGWQRLERQVLWPGVQLTNKLWSTRRRPTRNASQHLPPAQHQSNFLVKEFLERTACDNRFFSAYSIFATVHSFWPTKFSTDRTSDGLLRPVSIISKFNRIDCEWAEPERLGFAKNMPLKVLPASRLVSHLLVKEGGCSLEWTPSQWPVLPQHLYNKVNDGEAAHCYVCIVSQSSHWTMSSPLPAGRICSWWNAELGREWALHLAEVSTVLVWLQIKRWPHDPDRPTPFFLP